MSNTQQSYLQVTGLNPYGAAINPGLVPAAVNTSSASTENPYGRPATGTPGPQMPQMIGNAANPYECQTGVPPMEGEGVSGLFGINMTDFVDLKLF